MKQIPSIANPLARARGFNDWLAFGDKANAVEAGEPEFAEYEQGKKDAREWFYKKP